MTVQKIYLAEDLSKNSAEKEEVDYSVLNTDVIVKLDDDSTYRANFITMKKLASDFKISQERSKDMGKKYFWTKNMVIVDDIKAEDLRPMVNYMIDEGDFQVIFEKLTR